MLFSKWTLHSSFVIYPGVQPRVELQEKFHTTFPEALFDGFDKALADHHIQCPVLLIIDGT